jgi:hypothetical protein
MKGNLFEGLTEFTDTFFNRRPAPRSAAAEEIAEKKKGVTIRSLIERRKSVVLFEGQLYRITVEPVKVEEKP